MNADVKKPRYFFVLLIVALTALHAVPVRAADQPVTGIDEAKAAIETARQAGAEKTASNDITQARYWLSQAESEYAGTRSIFSRGIHLVVSNDAKIKEIQYLATMAGITARIAEAKARKASASDELKSTQKDLADYRAALEVLNKKSAEVEKAEKIKAQAEAERLKLAQEAALQKKKMQELDQAKQNIEDLEAMKRKELSDANQNRQQLAAQKAKEEAELQSLQQKAAMLDKTKAMFADAAKLPRATVFLIQKEILIRMKAGDLFASKNKIHTKGRSALDEVAGFLKKYPDGNVAVRCYDDNTGKAGTKRALTETRARAVKDYLVDFQNIPAERISAEGKGSADPTADNNTASGRAANKRVEISVAIGP
jgi:outer membrane protein OmpA-like peptidoglycan-associated protein